MPKKLTQKEAEDRSLIVGIKMVGEYKGANVKTKFKCPFCDKVFLCRPDDIFRKDNRATKSCGHCDDPKIGDRFGTLTITKVIPSNGMGCRVEAMCECGSKWNGNAYVLTSGSTKACGHCEDPKTGEKFGRLTIIKVTPSHIHGCEIEAICDCGKIWNGGSGHIRSGNTKSCGHCEDPKVGDRFDKLTIVKVIPRKNGSCSIEAKCQCGGEWHGIPSRLTIGNVRSCGNCKLKRNGLTTSFKALDLHKMLNNKGMHNYTTLRNGKSRICIDIAYVLNANKIAIEYDEWYWHGHKQDQDKKRMAKLRRNGWKTLRIKASKNLPSQEQLDKAIHKLAYTDTKSATITLPNWGNSNTRFPIQKEPKC